MADFSLEANAEAKSLFFVEMRFWRIRLTLPSVINITEVKGTAVEQHVKNGYRLFVAAVFYLKGYLIISRNDLLV